MPKEKACRRCKALTSGKICPVCDSTDLSPDWSGLAVVRDPGKSQIAKVLNIQRAGRYALSVS